MIFDSAAYDRFRMTVLQTLGERIREDDEVALALWCAISDTLWRHEDGGCVSFGFRGAGHLVAAIRGKGSYIDWYLRGCLAGPGIVREDIREVLVAMGWTPEEFKLDNPISSSEERGKALYNEAKKRRAMKRRRRK